jgi:RNA polymerase sigma factor (sigma-70 family)
MDDVGFAQRCIKADKEAWNEFIDKYSRLIYNYIHSVSRTKGSPLTPENIEDLFQEIFLSLIRDNFKKLKSFKGRNGCSLASWLRQVAINATIDYLRKVKPLVSIDEEIDDDFSLKEILADASPQVSDALISEEQFAQLKECIERLSTQDKFFLELHINRGLTLEIIRRVLKVSRGMVDMRKSRIIGRLKECFSHKGFMLDF